jgi:hypothetical protein
MKIHCFRCRTALARPGMLCPKCGFDPVAPDCPACKRPVSSAWSHSDELSSFAWHAGWTRWGVTDAARCIVCGHVMSKTMVLQTGHHDGGFFTQTPKAASSTMTIEPEQSDRVEPYDNTHHVPTIRITIDRAVPGDVTDDGGGLARHVRIELSIEECAALVEQLIGPLRTLMQREPWRVDRT